MDSNNKSHTQRLLKATFLCLFVLSFLYVFFLSGYADGPRVVEVNAEIASVQIIKTDGKDLSSPRDKLITPLHLSYQEYNENRPLVGEGSFSVDLGSNKKWKLTAHLKNRSEVEQGFIEAGWRLESLTVHCAGKTSDLNGKDPQIAAGDNGSFEFRVKYRFELKLVNRQKSVFSPEDIQPSLVLEVN